jgi:hypothetical protein
MSTFLNAQDNLIDNPYSLRLIVPQVYTTTPYGIDNPDAVISVGPFDNYQISSTYGFMETDIIVNPRNANNFVATDNRVITGNAYIFYTLDGGVNWGQVYAYGYQGDPVFAADSLGNLYFCVLNSGTAVYKSTNGGQSWNYLGKPFTNSQADKEWIAADQTTGAYQNHVYIAYVNFAASGGVDFWRSTNNGTSWSGPITIASGNQGANPGPNIAVDHTGKVYVAWNLSTGANIVWSNNGGASFSSPVSVASYVQPGTYNSTSGRYCVKGNIRTNGHPQIAIDLNAGSPRRGYVYLCYATNPAGPDIANVYFTRSTNGGTSWDYPILVNDDATTTDQWMPDISVDNQGRIWMYWCDSRNDASNVLTEVYGAVSTNGGVSFLPNFKISNQNFNPHSIKEYQGPEHYYMGDYSCISGKTMTFPCYSWQNNTRHNFVAYLPDYGMSFNKSIDSINPGSTSYVRVRAPMLGPYSGTVTYSASVTPSPAPGSFTFTFQPSNVKTFTGQPDSLTLQSTSTANVPQNLYTVTVTGTESGGPRTHSRSFQIRVGNFSGITQNSQTANSYVLSQNFPNPFNPSTIIDFSIPRQSLVSLIVFNMLGQEIERLVNNATMNAGTYSFQFDAKNLPSGIYYYKFTAADFSEVKKMILVR